MAKRSKKKRPRDVIGNAVHVMQIATGEVAEPEEPAQESAAAQLGRKGGQARAKSLSARKRKEIARKAAQARWSRRGKGKES